MPDTRAVPGRLQILAAFAAIWILWGSTYFAIRIVLETLPPFLTAGVRFLMAGGILFAVALARGVKLPTAAQWRNGAFLGGLFFVVGNGGVMWAEQWIPSGTAALLIATEPLLVVLLQRRRVSGWLTAGLALGIAGIAILVGPASIAGAGAVPLSVLAVLLMGCLAWAIGSLRGRTLDLPEDSLSSAAVQMLSGGLLLVAVGALHGDIAAFDWAKVSLRSITAVAYLTVFGSIVAFTAYGFLVRNVSPTRVATYAFVNPVVAVALGCLFGGEELTLRVALAAIVVVAGVVIITLKGGARTGTPKNRESNGGEAAPGDRLRDAA